MSESDLSDDDNSLASMPQSSTAGSPQGASLKRKLSGKRLVSHFLYPVVH